jgi:hypothetical protein
LLLQSKYSSDNPVFNLHLCSQLNVRDLISQQHRTIKLYVLLDSRWKEKRF